MNEVMNTELVKIENEIIKLKNQTAENILLMGQKFIEAKKLVPHGEWGNWLESKVGFSQRTANNFMRIAREYASNSQAISNLEVSKIYLLMELPVEEGEEFANQNDLKNMSTRDVKQKLKEHKRNAEIWNVVDKERDENKYDIPIDSLKPLPIDYRHISCNDNWISNSVFLYAAQKLNIIFTSYPSEICFMIRQWL